MYRRVDGFCGNLASVQCVTFGWLLLMQEHISFVFKHPVLLMYFSQIIPPSTMQLIYFLPLFFTFTTCFGRIWPSSGVPLPKLIHFVVEGENK
jgi:hypothetical protein